MTNEELNKCAAILAAGIIAKEGTLGQPTEYAVRLMMQIKEELSKKSVSYITAQGIK